MPDRAATRVKNKKDVGNDAGVVIVYRPLAGQ